MTTTHKTSRRGFLRRSARLAGALAAPAVISAASIGRAGAAAPSERLAIAQIGFGWIGGSHLGALLGRTDVQYVAACDVNGQKLQQVVSQINGVYAKRFEKALYKACEPYADFRPMLARKDIDAVVIATPDHWHGPLTIWAAREGKDIYSEKPLSLTIAEGRAMVQAVRRYGRVFQTGSQQRSSVFGPFRLGCELIRSGRIGKVLTVDVSTGDPPVACNLPAEPCPDYFDWEMWLGQAPWRPFHSKLASVSWRPYTEFCGGGLADMGAHHFDIAQWALNMDHTGPVEVLPPDPAANRPRVSFRYASGVIMNHVGGNCLGLTLHGSDGELYIGRDGLRSNPPQAAREKLGPGDVRLYQSNDHHGNWIDCIRTRRLCVADVEIGHRSATICHLANIAYALRRPLKWDPAAEQFTGDDLANRLLSRAARAPWCLG